MKILVYVSSLVKAWTIPDASVAALRDRFPDIEFVHARTDDEALAGIVDVDAVLASRLTPTMIAAATRLRWVHSSAVNVIGLLPLEALAARGILVTNSRGIQGIPIAETVMGGLLMLTRKLHRMHDAQRDRRWIQNALVDDMPYLLSGKRMAIVGLGGIGLEIAKRADAFGMSVVGVRRHPAYPVPSSVRQVYGPDHLDDALMGADVLVIAAPSGSATEQLIGAPQLARLTPGAILVNVARASIVYEPALLTALQHGALGGAVLDVFGQEPLPESHPFWEMPNVILTPHAAGFNRAHWEHTIAVYGEQLMRFCTGAPLERTIDVATGY